MFATFLLTNFAQKHDHMMMRRPTKTPKEKWRLLNWLCGILGLNRPPGVGVLHLLLEVFGELVSILHRSRDDGLPVVPLVVAGVGGEGERLVVVQDGLHRLVRVEQLVAVLPDED